MVLDCSHAAAARRAQHHRAADPPASARSQTRSVVHQLVDRRIDEARKLNLCHGAETLCGKADGYAGNRRLRQRRIEDAFGAKARQKTVRRAEHAAIGADILAQHKHAGVLLHRARQGESDRLHQ